MYEGASAVQEWAKRFYKSAAWQSTRDAYLAAHDGMCERCAAAGRLFVPVGNRIIERHVEPGETTAATVVHHRKYLTRRNIKDPAIALGWDNLEAVLFRRERPAAEKINRHPPPYRPPRREAQGTEAGHRFLRAGAREGGVVPRRGEKGGARRVNKTQENARTAYRVGKTAA